jgi:hypothetical protein
MKSLAPVVLLGVAAAVATVVGCSGGPWSGLRPGASDAGEANTGRVGLQLTLDPGVVVNSVSYTITGPNAFTRTRTLDLTAAAGIIFTEGLLPAGGPYTIALSAISVDGTVTCAGMGTFTIIAGTTVGVAVPLLCHKKKTTGSVQVDASFDVCPNIDGIDTNPQETTVGNSVMLIAHTTDVDPKATVTFSWTAPSGTFAPADAATTSFTCTAPGSVLVSLDITDGVCGDSSSLLVQCDESTGTAVVDAGPASWICPSIDGINASPQETTVGNSVSLHADASSFYDNPITYVWTAPSGTFSAPNAADTDFTCTVKGPVDATLNIMDGGSCGDTFSITIQCD